MRVSSSEAARAAAHADAVAQADAAAPDDAAPDGAAPADAARRDGGWVTVWLLVAMPILLIMVGIGVDLVAQVQTQQRAQDVAAQAARVAGEQLQAGQAMRGDGAAVDPATAVQAARAYLAAATGLTGTVSVAGGDVVVVQTTAVYHPIVLGLVGVGDLRVTGTARARPVRAVDGVNR